ncbi:hypothetical protein INR49_032599 [Caranx melampygus]|nr:hypothetical protein INR49_032599 [Caranx melampygus]
MSQGAARKSNRPVDPEGGGGGAEVTGADTRFGRSSSQKSFPYAEPPPPTLLLLHLHLNLAPQGPCTAPDVCEDEPKESGLILGDTKPVLHRDGKIAPLGVPVYTRHWDGERRPGEGKFGNVKPVLRRGTMLNKPAGGLSITATTLPNLSWTPSSHPLDV